MSAPDIQFFPASGTWVKPPNAARVDIVLKGGDGGDAVANLGSTEGGEGGGASHIGHHDNPSAYASYTAVLSTGSLGDPGALSVMSYAASDLPDTVEVEVGKGGRPGGRDGYALIVTHLTDDGER